MKTLKMCVLTVAIALFALPAMGEKKLLPIKITGDRFSLTYAYDSENRIKSIVEDNVGLIEVKIFDYFTNGMGYITYTQQYDSEESYINQAPYQTDVDSTNFITRTNSTVNFNRDSENLSYTFSPSGKLKEVDVKSRHSQLKRAFEPKVVIGFRYTDNDNLEGINLPDKEIADKLNPRIRHLASLGFVYDTHNGIFKHVNPACFSEIYREGMPLNYFFFMSNNLLSTSCLEGNECNDLPRFSYKYNADNYPSEVVSDSKVYSITYVEAR